MNLIEELESGRMDFLNAVEGLTEATASRKPSSDRWSILECIDHLVTVEERFQGWLQTGSAEASAANPENEARLYKMLTDRSAKVSAPEAVLPTGRFGTLADAVLAFSAARDRSVNIVKERGDRLYSIGAKHHRFGDLNGVEVVHLMAGHARRHAAQIRETRAAIE